MSGQADSLGQRGVALGGVEDPASGHADRGCGLRNRAAEAQERAEVIAFLVVEDGGPAAFWGGRRRGDYVGRDFGGGNNTLNVASICVYIAPVVA